MVRLARLLSFILINVAFISGSYAQTFDYTPPPLNSNQKLQRDDLQLEYTGINTNKTDFVDIDTCTEIAAIVAGETGTCGSIVFSVSPSLVTPSLGVATATTINGATIISGTLNGTVTGTNTGDDDIPDVVSDLALIDTSSELRTLLTDEIGTGFSMFGLISTMSDDLGCTASQVVRRNSGDTAFECATAGAGDALVANPLSQFAATTSTQLKGVLSDEIGTGNAMFGIISTMSDDLGCTGSQVVRRNSGDTAFECATPAGSGDALVANPLSQFAATTSAQFAGVITNETGTGLVVLDASPALSVNPTAPTASLADNDTSIATTAFVQANKSSFTEYDKGAYAVSTIYTQAHGLGSVAAVKNYQIFLENTTAASGWAVGDRVLYLSSSANASATAAAMTVGFNATNLYVATGVSLPAVNNLSTGVSAAIVAANWKVIMRVGN